MANTPRLFASMAFTAIAIFLLGYTWLPAYDDLRREEAKITHITPQPNMWHQVELTTSSNARITCRTKRGWPLVGPNRCPLEKFEHLLGQTVNVAHDGKQPYEVAVGSQIVMDYSAHRKAQTLAIILAGLMLAMAILVWGRK